MVFAEMLTKKQLNSLLANKPDSDVLILPKLPSLQQCIIVDSMSALFHSIINREISV